MHVRGGVDDFHEFPELDVGYGNHGHGRDGSFFVLFWWKGKDLNLRSSSGHMRAQATRAAIYSRVL